jgi:hypothetical protein
VSPFMAMSLRYTGLRRSVNLDEIGSGGRISRGFGVRSMSGLPGHRPAGGACSRSSRSSRPSGRASRAPAGSLSGLQKTTSHQFEGRWEGESTRSAYLFFHSEGSLRGREHRRLPRRDQPGAHGQPRARGGSRSPRRARGAFRRAPDRSVRSRLPSCLPEHATPVTLRLRLQTGRRRPRDGGDRGEVQGPHPAAHRAGRR